ncbi:tetratricopeptide repeat protein [Sphaerotilus sp.]|uniref:tetratricopeptide repeat protein n=1 Tax=Sphaerotilus sp. TaxID=2093942 RepID=UPI002ACF071F|nr:tetratricopeptide repeat protein [Sphaerotilus sp.]MDZ7857630.1 tetratricopeptide repeat protein [Sphaerotilus sp.]
MLNIVVARRGEDMRWVDDLPDHCTVTVYTDDASQGVPLDVTRHIELVRLPGQHTTGELYLAHLKRPARGAPEGFTVFCPGDPLAVCPAFFALLDSTMLWGEVQPLSQLPAGQGSETASPARDWRAELPVSPVRFDLRSWAPLGTFDKVMYRAQQRYRQTHQLLDHHHPGAHFFEACQLGAMAQAVSEHDLGVRDSGLLFAVQRSRITAWQAAHGPALPQICSWLRQDPVHGRIWDQFWLHLFGLPFVRLNALTTPASMQFEEDDDAPEDFSLSRALATIDDTLARLAPPPLTRASDRRPSALQVARAIAAAQARHAPTPSPGASQELTDLSERAAQAFRLGDLQYAIACARLALKIEADHTASRFTLAMALAAQGSREEALEQFEHLLQTGASASDGIRVPERTTSTARPQ